MATQASFHPALRQSVCDLLAARALRRVAELVESGAASDEAIGRLVRESKGRMFGL